MGDAFFKTHIKNNKLKKQTLKKTKPLNLENKHFKKVNPLRF